MSATIQTNPARITLSWPADPASFRYTLYRKTRDATAWGNGTVLATDATNYVDAGVGLGIGYEYRVVKIATNVAAVTGYTGEGYLYAGFGLPLVENRGKVVLVIDTTHTNALAAELARLEQDLIGDGWSLVRHNVARTDSVVSIRNLIRNDYNAAPTQVRAVLLFGHVPVPYSGDYAPDGHTDHRGAWPADGYYGDLDGNWTDTMVNRATAAETRNRNVPGDGKFDQTQFPSGIELQVGRVDLANLPAYSLSEVELLRRYLNKNHAFRHRQFVLERRGLIDDHFGVFGGEAFAVNGWRNFTGLFGDAQTIAGDWLNTLGTQGFLWGYGCGDGTYTSANGVGSTELFAGSDPRVAFAFLFGSYFGDWDSSNNFMRAALATPTYTLTCAWAGRPHWAIHHMAMGETIGFSTRVTQNNVSLYAANGSARLVHLSLLGDPTLRLHTVQPPSNFVIQPDGGGMMLRWQASPEATLGYTIYRGLSAAGPFARVNPQLVTNNTYSINSSNTGVYMVRAVTLETSAGGTYHNMSQGIFQDLAGNFGPPRLSITQDEQTVWVAWPARFSGYQLESAEACPAVSWAPVAASPQLSNTMNVVTQPVGAPRKFFRLRNP
jgi:hypothetical protein